MTDYSPETIADRIHAAAVEGRLIQHNWHKTDDEGRELVCLYSAAVKGAVSTRNCPADSVPQWFADLMPIINDYASEKDYVGNAIAIAKALPAMTDETWDQLFFKTLEISVSSALSSAEKVAEKSAEYWPLVRDACTEVIEACKARDRYRLKAAEAAAWAARAAAGASAAAAWAARAARAAAWAAEAAAWAAEAAAWAAAWTAARSNLANAIVDAMSAIAGTQPAQRTND